MKDDLRKFFLREFNIPLLGKTTSIIRSFSLKEKTVFVFLAVILSVSAFIMAWQINLSASVIIPAPGGSLTEGVIGTPRFINPLLAISDADRDLTTLIYSGLMKATPEGKMVPSLAESYFISEDGLQYVFKIRDDAFFHDNTPITADDIVFTIKKAQDPDLKSPRRPSWDGVSVEKIDDKTVRITLKQRYSPFLENTALGILPAHIWSSVSTEQFAFSQFNSEPIGSGPYKLKSIKRNSGGIPTSYTLVPFSNYTLGKPYISQVNIKFYSSEANLVDAYQNGEIESIGAISPQKAAAIKALGARVERVSLPRIFGVFFNQDQSNIFTLREVRVALNKTVDRQRIIDEVFKGYGVPIFGPIPITFIEPVATGTIRVTEESLQEMREYLEKNGWKPNKEDGILEKTVKKETYRLEFSISTSNVDELKETAKIIKEDWEKLGAKIEIKLFDTSDLNQNVIRPRKYDSLLFGEVIGRDLDLFAFWHSSQRNDPGLNIALYTNIATDKSLEVGRTAESMEKRLEEYGKFAKEVANDIPAVFTHSPDYIYILPKKIKGFDIGAITIPPERFLNVHLWHINTDRVWKIFAN